MQLRAVLVALMVVLGVFAAASGRGGENGAEPEHGIDVDFLFSYYDQDGEHSPVTGGIGTEEQQVVSPVILVGWQVNDDWTIKADIGVDQITSASMDNIDAIVSSASRKDVRSFTTVAATRAFGSQSLGVIGGFSNEYDYQSLSAGLAWSLDLNQQNTTLAASVRHFEDTVDLYDIYGINRGEDDRRTTDLSFTLTQVLGRRTVAAVELFHSAQSGFLSTPYHEVILAPTDGAPEGLHIAERLPDSRGRLALGLRLNHSFSPGVVGRFGYRNYDDDWGIAAQTVEVEIHFRLPGRAERWIYPILRFHDQTGSDHYVLPLTASGDEDYLTSDGDLGEFRSDKFGLGWRAVAPPAETWWLGIRRFEARLTSYSRDDGLDSMTAALGFGWSF